MGVDITSSSRAAVEFEDCPYCHSESAVKHEYITDAKGGWDVVKYTCLKCACQFIYNCREARPHPILVQVPGDSWPFRYTTESEVWRDLLGYKNIEKPKEETMQDKSTIKFKVDEFDAAIKGCRIGDTMKFDGKTYVAMDQLDYDKGCYNCDLCQECQDLHHGEFATDICNTAVIFKEKEEEVKESTSDDLYIFYDYSKDDFKHLFNFRVGFKFLYGNNMYEVAEVAKAPTTEFHCKYDCALYNECRCGEDCPDNIYFKECCTKKKFDDADYQGDLRTVFSFPVGYEFRYGDSKVAVRKSRYTKKEDSYLDCDDCAFREECGEADAGCPSGKWYEVIGKLEPKQEPANKENKPMVEASKMRDYSTGPFEDVLNIPEGEEFRFGDHIYRAISIPADESHGCSADCDLYDYCYNDKGEYAGMGSCPGSRCFKMCGRVFNRCSDCGEYALKVCLNASPEGVTKHVLNVSMVPGDDGIPDIDKLELEHMTNAATVVCTHCGKRRGTFGSWRTAFKPVHSFITDEGENEDIGAYKTEEEAIAATLHELNQPSKKEYNK